MYYSRGRHNNSGFPIKNESQTHWLISWLQDAPTPHITSSHLSLHLPPIHTLGGVHEVVVEQVSGTQTPPGNGLPLKPSAHLHVAPEDVTIHWAPSPQLILEHSKRHFWQLKTN